jgi:hypothetical protein
MTIPGILFRPRRLGQGIIKYSLKRRSSSWRDVVFDKYLISQAWNRRIKALRLGFSPPKSVDWLPCWCTRYRRLPKWSVPQDCLAFLKRERSIRTFVHGRTSSSSTGRPTTKHLRMSQHNTIRGGSTPTVGICEQMNSQHCSEYHKTHFIDITNEKQASHAYTDMYL